MSYVVLQLADLLASGLALPGWLFPTITALLILGFPIALVLAWAYELTPDGMRRTEPAAAGELAAILAEPRRRRWPAGILALGGLVLFVAGGWWAVGRSGMQARGSGAEESVSLAVLPFANMARTAETEPFVEGVHDDLLTQLSKIGSLRVISRTSVLGYRNSDKMIPQIAAELGVTHVLEGGVQRAGDAVRINVQLIDGRTDEHVWAETYNRTLSVAEVFAIQSEIAQAIADALRARVGPEERPTPARPTESLAAYDHYQRGLVFFRRSQIPEDVGEAAKEFEAAVRADPRFADAWARLAIARATLSWEWGIQGELAPAAAAVDRAEALAPDRLLPQLARAYYHYYGERDYDGALAALERAEALAPGDADVALVTAWVLRRLGRFDDALAHFEKAYTRDPRNLETVVTYAWTEVVVRSFDEAERLGQMMISIAPERPGSHHLRVLLPILRSGDSAAAALALEQAARRIEPARILLSWPPVSRIMARRFEKNLRATTSAAADDSVGFQTQWQYSGLTPTAIYLQKAQALRALGDGAGAYAHFDSARVLLEQQVRAHPPESRWNYQGDLPAALGVAYAGLGRHEEAIHWGRLALETLDRVGDRYMRPRTLVQLAEIHLLAGENDLALDRLEEAVRATGLFSAASVRIDPLWAPLGAHPRFQRLVAGAN